MDTINISLPSQLKIQAQALVKQGYFVSFSDLVRTALRRVVAEGNYEKMVKVAENEYRSGKTKALSAKKDIAEYVKKPCHETHPLDRI